VDEDEDEDEDDYLDDDDTAQLAMLARLRGVGGGAGGGSGGGAGPSGAGTSGGGGSSGGAGRAAGRPTSSPGPQGPYGFTFRSWDAPRGWEGATQQQGGGSGPPPPPQARAEVAVRLISRPDAATGAGSPSPSTATSSRADARAMLELQQHLAAVPLFSLFLPCWKGRAQLLCVFCPHAAVGLGDVALPATAYLLDVSSSRRAFAAAVLAVRPALEDDGVVTVTCSARSWMMQANAAIGATTGGASSPGGPSAAPLHPRCVLDVQQMRALEVQLRRHGTPGSARSSNAPVRPASLKQLTLWAGLYHPIRHDPRSEGGIRPWQQRPLPADCVECAAADTILLVLVCEWIAPLLQRTAGKAMRLAAPAPALEGGLAPAVPATSSAALATALAMPSNPPASAVWARLRDAANRPELSRFLTQQSG
jgi:hypothetical protein